MSAPNIVNVSTITGKSAVLAAVGTSATNLVANSASSNKVFKINTIIVSNDHDSPVTLTVDLYRSSTAYKLIDTVSIAQNSSFTPIDKSIPIYLEEGDTLRVTAGTASKLDVICSYEEISYCLLMVAN